MFDYENQEKEKLIEEKFNDTMNRQQKFSNKFLIIFMSCFPSIFLILGILLTVFNVVDEDGTKVGIVFIGLAVFFLIIFLVIFLITNKYTKTYNYDKYKKRIKKYGMINSYDLMISVSLQNERIEELEHKVEQLQEEIDYLKGK